ncbi:MAG TPA: hypothetical protein VJV78_06780 [Polyangiales bacterium]|nr:hypothetical protein [Polyangiales bacterium]
MRRHARGGRVRLGQQLLAAFFAWAGVTSVSPAAAQEIVPVDQPPSYDGSKNGNAECNTPYVTVGWRPKDGGKRPLFLYFIGTLDPLYYPPDPGGEAVVKAMAREGYTALQVQYDSRVNLAPWQLGNKAACVYDANRARSLLHMACDSGRNDVDCSRGIAVWGHSQGAAMAVMGPGYDARVSAAWLTGFADYTRFKFAGVPVYTGDTRAWVRTRVIPTERMRIVNGSADEFAATSLADLQQKMRRITGLECAQSPCLQGANRSGWLLVQRSQLATNKPDHCWFNYLPSGLNPGDFGMLPDDCQGAFSLERNWLEGPRRDELPAGAPWTDDMEFALKPSARWLAQTAALGPIPRVTVNVDFAYLPLNAQGYQQAFGAYPWGVIDWPADSNFFARAGAADPRLPASSEEPRHMTIGSGTAATSARFDFHNAKGGTLVGYWVYNTSTSPTTVTTELTKVSGPPSTSTETVPGFTAEPDPAHPRPTPPHKKLIFTVGEGVKTVKITSSSGASLRISNMVVLGPE